MINKLTKAGIIILVLGLMVVSSSTQAIAGDLRLQYKVGEGLNIGDGDNLVHLQGRTQTRLTYQTVEGRSNTAGFSVSRAEIRLDGFTLEKKLKFGFEMNLGTRARATTATVCTNAACGSTASAVTTESTTGLAVLNDYYVDWVPETYFGIQMGQFKVPFLMQQLTSSTKQQFVDRGLSTTVFDWSRDIGANVHGSVLNNKLNYNLFLFNGDGANTLNRNSSAMMVGSRIEVPILGTYVNSEGDVGNSEDHNLGFGVAYLFNEPVGSIQGGTIAASQKAHHGTFDIGYKHKGLSIQNAEMISREIEGTKKTNWGHNTQVGYFVVPKKVEVAVRGGAAVFSNATTNQYEYAGGLNYYIAGHGIKLQADYTTLLNSGGVQNQNDHRLRAAMNFIF